MKSPDSLRSQLARFIDWEEAHVGFETAIDGLPASLHGSRAAGFEHSPWQLLEHMRMAQQDLLDFCLNPAYVHALKWPDDYWPSPAPPDDSAWAESVRRFTADREKLKKMVMDEGLDLFATVPTGTGQQTHLRSVLLVADHNAYHLGQLVALRRALGAWR